MYLKDKERIDAKLDPVGMALLAIGLVCISYGAVHFVSVGSGLTSTALFAAGIVFIAIFGWWDCAPPLPCSIPASSATRSSGTRSWPRSSWRWDISRSSS